MLLYMICHFFLTAFNILSLLCTINVSAIICLGVFIFWFYLLGILKDCCTWMAVSFSRFGKYLPVILLNMLSTHLAYTSFPSSMTMICRFDFSIVSQGFCMLHLYLFFPFLYLVILRHLSYLLVLISFCVQFDPPYWRDILLSVFYLTYETFVYRVPGWVFFRIYMSLSNSSIILYAVFIIPFSYLFVFSLCSFIVYLYPLWIHSPFYTCPLSFHWSFL
jgi:hypothetical protein